MIEALLLGLLIGVLLGLLGGGGSILAVPALLYGVGMPLAKAIPTSLLVVGISSLSAALPRLRRDVHWRVAGIFGGAGAVTAFAGTAVNGLLDPWVVILGFAAVMVAAGVQMLRGRDDETGGSCDLPGGGVNWRSCLPKAIGAGAVVGFLTGLFGVGGGFLIIPALVMGLGLSMQGAIGTSLVIIVVNSAAGLVAHSGRVELDYGIAGAFAGAAVVGSLGAARFAHRVPARRLRTWFAGFVIVVAVLLVVQVAIDPSAVAGSSG